MGMDAELFAMGKYSPAVQTHLEYPANFYIGTKPGKLVFSVLFQCNTTSQSEDLADILGIDDAWDFNQHVINVAKLTDVARLRLTDLPHGDEDLDHMDALAAAGFVFIYRPNG